MKSILILCLYLTACGGGEIEQDGHKTIEPVHACMDCAPASGSPLRGAK